MVFGLLNGLSSVSFYVINWIFLFIVIQAVYRIRHMKDRLDIRTEMIYVVVLWFAFDTFQYFFFELNQLALCPESYSNIAGLIGTGQLGSYISIILRDLSVMLVTAYFLVSVN